MLHKLKQLAYFPIARYFRFWAGIKLARWSPRIVVITGSNGKTTTLHLVESQLGSRARYSHKANSAFGIPFDVLGLGRKTLRRWEWAWMFIQAPFRAFATYYPESIYVVEADCDRPNEGDFLGSWLKPEVTIWIDSSRTHSQHFDYLVESGLFPNVDSAIAYEFGRFVKYTSKLVMANGDNELVLQQTRDILAKIQLLSISELRSYEPTLTHTTFRTDSRTLNVPALLPREFFYALGAVTKLMDYLQLPLDENFSQFALPPGRSSVLAGQQGTTIIDSSYNANLASDKAILEMVDGLRLRNLWVVLGDFTEQGKEEAEEHAGLAELLKQVEFEKLILVGPRLARFTYPELPENLQKKTVLFERPLSALHHIQSSLRGGEALLFKGARFLEGVIEHILQDPKDSARLCRREEIWQIRRKQWGL